MREPLLGVAVGRKGVGKSFTTNKLIEQYVVGNLRKPNEYFVIYRVTHTERAKVSGSI